jgi:hypothetical protein
MLRDSFERALVCMFKQRSTQDVGQGDPWQRILCGLPDYAARDASPANTHPKTNVLMPSPMGTLLACSGTVTQPD